MDAKTQKPKLNPEQQTAFKVRFLKPEYWGWFDAVAATFIVANENDSAHAMTIPEAAELGIEPQRYTAWKFPDGHVEIVRPPVLEIIDVHVDFPEHLAAGFFPHEMGGTDWFLIREADHAMANVTRAVDPWDPEAIHLDMTGAKIN